MVLTVKEGMVRRREDCEDMRDGVDELALRVEYVKVFVDDSSESRKFVYGCSIVVTTV